MVATVAGSLVVLGATLGSTQLAGAATRSSASRLVYTDRVVGPAQGIDPAPYTGLTAVTASNWSGWADTGSTFSSVGSSWTVPTVSCPTGKITYSAQWIGIDGYTSDTVEQDGTSADCVLGTASYSAWYEMYGDSAVNGGAEVELNPSTYPVSPGNVMSASVSVVDNVWTLTISDGSLWSYSTSPITFSAAQASAEWIVERPAVCGLLGCHLSSLADFGTITFTGATVTGGGASGVISSFTDTRIEMKSGSTVLAVPTRLNSSGNAFRDTWEASS